MKNLLILLAAALAVSACAPTPVSPAGSGPGMSSGAANPDPVDSANARTSPTAMLRQQGRSQMAAGQYNEAAATLERALRIEPRDPWLWLELAEVHRASGELEQAATHARKAASLAGGDELAERAAASMIEQLEGR